MVENPDRQSPDSPAFDRRIQTENIAFDAKEMITCGCCGRINPPNRLKCLYCAKELDVKIDGSVKPNLRKLDLWERGFSVILKEKAAGIGLDTGKIGDLLSLELADLTAILDSGTSLPLARVESEKMAAVLDDQLLALGLKCLVVSDADLAPDKLPVRLAAIDLSDRHLTFNAFNTGKVTEIATGDLLLLVPGLIATGRVDSLEKRRRHGQTKIIEETAIMSDESVLDIYSRQDPTGFRVHLAGFDFSSLGEDKGLLAVENLRLLIVALKEHAPSAKLVSDYATVRRELGSVWEIEARKDPQGLQRSGFGKVEFGSVASTSNLNQFTKYSRLQWHLI